MLEFMLDKGSPESARAFNELDAFTRNTLTRASKEWASVSVYAGDDGKIYVA
jgi:hypothetical protein